VQDGARRVLQVADEHDLKFGRALGRCLLGEANTGSGRPEDGWRMSMTASICTTA
jgi:hypothetical protein